MSSGRWWRWWCLLIGAVFVVVVASSSASQTKQNRLVSRIAFGSCSDQADPQLIWNAIINFDPQVFIWLGDNIYGDIKRPFKLFGKERTIGPWKNVPRFVPTSKEEMESKYVKAKTNPGKEFGGKIVNQRLLLDFLDEAQNSPRRKQDGVYVSYTFGPVRYHRDPLLSDGTILGNSQWTWLEKELNGPASAITIIGSSVQVLSNLSAATGPLFSFECWGRFPRERDRLFKLIADSKRDGVFFISGDVHFGELARYDCATGYPLYDITSSGLTKAVEKAVPPPLHFIVRFVARLTPTTMRVMDRNCRYSSCIYGQPNFGAIEIDWDATPVTLRIEVRDINGFPVTGVKVSLLELQAGSVDPVATIKAGEYRRHCTLEVNLPWLVRYRLAILFYSAVAVLLLALIGFTYATISISRRFLPKCKHD
uniref:PhoD-like phosphatase metallophosphatase domain-containing protein n=1 Tax=Fagus sylvatica TaxID=28930 RepID=A0A2N9I4T3_FAGSY